MKKEMSKAESEDAKNDGVVLKDQKLKLFVNAEHKTSEAVSKILSYGLKSLRETASEECLRNVECIPFPPWPLPIGEVSVLAHHVAFRICEEDVERILLDGIIPVQMDHALRGLSDNIGRNHKRTWFFDMKEDDGNFVGATINDPATGITMRLEYFEAYKQSIFRLIG